MEHENEICSLEQSKALKKLGFHGKTYCFYAKNEEEGTWLTSTASGIPLDWNMREERETPFMTVVCSAPMLWTAQKWLRDEKGIDIFVKPRFLEAYEVAAKKLGYSPISTVFLFDLWDANPYPTYESALSAGITQAINLLNQEKK